MASRKFCDRCGKVIEPPRFWLRFRPYRYRLELDRPGGSYDEYDFCPDCMLKFQEFMENKNENEPSDDKIHAGGLY